MVDTLSLGTQDAVRVQVSGKAFYSGRATFIFDEGDELGQGFLCR